MDNESFRSFSVKLIFSETDFLEFVGQLYSVARTSTWFFFVLHCNLHTGGHLQTEKPVWKFGIAQKFSRK